MDKIIKISRCFKRVFTVIFVGWPIVLAVIWFGPQQGGLLVNIGLTINNFIPAGLIFLIAYMMQECLKLREEQALTV